VTPTVEQQGLPIVRELHRIAGGADAPAVKLEGALEVLFGAFGEADAQFSGLVLGGWMKAREDKQFRLTMAWLREQMRLSLAEIVAEGVEAGAFRSGLAPEAVAAVILGAAEGCLLQTATQGGPVPPADILGTLLRLLLVEPGISGA
jgi:transcriptional regulator BetI-like protein